LRPSSGRIRVALIFGGRSGEHEISLRSADSIKRALDPARYSLAEYFIDKEGKWHPAPLSPEPAANPGIDVVFPALHGTFGEDGTVQGLLELAGLPYVGSDVLSSAAAMDKAVTKKLCLQAGLPIGPHIVLPRTSRLPDLPFGFPMFVKPANLGSSVGIRKVKNRQELEEALEYAAQYDRKILVEKGIVGREFECGVLAAAETQASVPCEVIPSQEFYTYEDKYLLDRARIELPARLSAEQTSEMQRLAIACFDAIGCEGMARVDFLMEAATGQIYINEINTIPGFTSISMYPKMFEYSGIPYAKLLDILIESALHRAESRLQTQYSR
jgi:D-alanine-D-alanine ligase